MQKYRVTVGEYTPGAICFYKPGTGVLHRIDGPAVVNVDGGKAWYQNGQLHRLDGPAIRWADGTFEYWINGKELTEAQFKKATAPVKEMTVAEIEKCRDCVYSNNSSKMHDCAFTSALYPVRWYCEHPDKPTRFNIDGGQCPANCPKKQT